MSLIILLQKQGLDDGSENEVNPAENNAGQENEGETADGGPRNLSAHKCKLLYAKTLSSAPESSNDYRQTGLRRSKIQVELLDYVSMDLSPFTCGDGDIPIKIDSLAFWKSKKQRFPYLSKLSIASYPLLDGIVREGKIGLTKKIFWQKFSLVVIRIFCVLSYLNDPSFFLVISLMAKVTTKN